MKPQDMGIQLSHVKNWRANLALSPSPVPTYPIESILFFSLLLQMFFFFVFVNNIQATAWSTDNNSSAKMETKQTRALAFNPLVL